MAIIKDAAVILGLDYVKNKNVAWGAYRGFVMVVEPKFSTQKQEISFFLCASFQGAPLDARKLQSVKMPDKVRCYMDHYKINMVLEVSGGNDKNVEKLVEATRAMVDFVMANFGVNCDDRGIVGLTNAWCMKGKCILLSEETAMLLRTTFAQNYAIAAKKKENYILGALGALLGAAIGGLVILLVARLGFISTICSAVMGVTVIFGYKKLGGKFTGISWAICMLISMAMVYFVFHLDAAIDFALAFKEIGVTDVPFSLYLTNVKNLYALGESTRTYYIKLFCMVSINAGGAGIAGCIEWMEQKQQFEFYRL